MHNPISKQTSSEAKHFFEDKSWDCTIKIVVE
nr:MAG TPA: hypothetical protein [Caudoviricetes sp.]